MRQTAAERLIYGRFSSVPPWGNIWQSPLCSWWRNLTLFFRGCNGCSCNWIEHFCFHVFTWCVIYTSGRCSRGKQREEMSHDFLLFFIIVHFHWYVSHIFVSFKVCNVSQGVCSSSYKDNSLKKKKSTVYSHLLLSPLETAVTSA